MLVPSPNIPGTTWNFFMHDGSLESSRQVEKDNVFSNSVSVTFTTWLTLKPEIAGNGEHVELSTKFQQVPQIFHQG